MKKLFAFSLIFFPFLLIGQIKLINKDLINQDLNQLYLGIENHLQIVGQSDLSRFKMTSSKSEITSKDSIFSVFPTHIGIDTLKIFKDKKLILTTLFEVIRIGNPVGQLAFTFDSVISLNRILANPYLTVKIPNSNYNLDFRIYSFKCDILKKNNDRKTFISSNGPKLTDEMLSKIQDLLPGDIIEFENIKCGFISSDIRLLAPFRITIK